MRQRPRRMKTVKAVLVSALLVTTALPALAQPDAGPGTPPAMGMTARLLAERLGMVEPGLYSTGEGGTTFMLTPYARDKYLLRIQGQPENFVLTSERGSMGTRFLKYDTGATALRVSVWGGLTLYTQGQPGGMPATRQGDAPPLPQLAVSSGELATAFNDEGHHLVYVQKVAVKFSADPAVMQADPETRGRAFDALTNAALGIERFLASLPVARPVFAKRVNAVKVAEGGKPTVALSGQTLLVSFVPGGGYEGHASSLAIAQELGKLFAVTPRDMASK